MNRRVGYILIELFVMAIVGCASLVTNGAVVAVSKGEVAEASGGVAVASGDMSRCGDGVVGEYYAERRLFSAMVRLSPDSSFVLRYRRGGSVLFANGRWRSYGDSVFFEAEASALSADTSAMGKLIAKVTQDLSSMTRIDDMSNARIVGDTLLVMRLPRKNGHMAALLKHK